MHHREVLCSNAVVDGAGRFDQSLLGPHGERRARGRHAGPASSQLLAWWLVATAMLMAQEDLSRGERERWRAEAERVRLAKEGRARVDLFKRAILDYLRPSFHPDDRDDYALAREYLTSVGAEV